MKVGTDGVLLGAWAQGGRRVLDIGTGTGVVALMMAQRFPEATVTAVELDPDAALQARQNADDSPFAARIRIVQGDVRLLKEESGEWRVESEEWRVVSGECRVERGERTEREQTLSDEKKIDKEIEEARKREKREWEQGRNNGAAFDAITCNPPYYEHTLPSRSQQRDMARSAETLSMAELMTVARRWLSPEGVLSMVLPTTVGPLAEAEAALRGLYVVRRTLVKTVERKPPKRVLLAFSPKRPDGLQEQTVVLQTASGARSDWYQQLTHDFYL